MELGRRRLEWRRGPEEHGHVVPTLDRGWTFDGDSAMRHFSARGYHAQGHRLAAGHDEYGPYFRLLEVSSDAKRSRSFIWGRCFGRAGAAVIELDDDPPAGQPTAAAAGATKNVVADIYDDIWPRPSLFRLALPTWLGGMDAPVHHAERTAFVALQRGWVDSDSLLSMLQFLPGRSAPRDTTGRDATTAGSEPKQFLAGAYVYGGQAGVMRNTLLYPWTCIALVSLAKQLLQDRPFSSFSLSRDVLSRPHRDLNNDKKTLNVVVPLTRWKGGEVWVESATGQSVLLPGGQRGTKHKVEAPFLLFEGSALHATCPWEGTRLVLVLYHIRDGHLLADSSDRLLRRLGFQLMPRSEKSQQATC